MTVDRISASDLGRRVVVRYRVPGGGLATDVLGRLAGWAGDQLQVRRSDGQLVSIRLADVVAAKPVPPRPVVRREVRALEAAAARGWQALETAQIGGWLLRAAGGFTGRANSCLPLSAPGMTLSDAVREVERWYESRKLVPAFQVPEPLAAEVNRALGSQSWSRSPVDVLVLTVALAPVAARFRIDLPPVVVADAPDLEWLASYRDQRGGDLPSVARHVLINCPVVGFASIDAGGRRLAIGRGTVSDTPDGTPWLGIAAIHVVADARRRGLSTQVMAALTKWGRQQGATDGYVQVAEPNTAAVATYERLGFTEHHRYHYRRRYSQS